MHRAGPARRSSSRDVRGKLIDVSGSARRWPAAASAPAPAGRRAAARSATDRFARSPSSTPVSPAAARSSARRPACRRPPRRPDRDPSGNATARTSSRPRGPRDVAGRQCGVAVAGTARSVAVRQQSAESRRIAIQAGIVARRLDVRPRPARHHGRDVPCGGGVRLASGLATRSHGPRAFARPRATRPETRATRRLRGARGSPGMSRPPAR